MDTHVALVSGGMDSTVAADVAVRWGPADLLVYLDTGTGLEANRRYIERLADWMGVQLWTLRTHESYSERVRNHGFPGSSRHGIMYRSLKERQIQTLAARVDELHCWTGVRYQESARRMKNVEPESEAAGGRWTWHAPIAGWSKDECRAYIRRYEIPCNPLWDDLGRSGDCYCGCFASPEEKIDTLAAGGDGRVAYLDALEDLSDQGNETDRWAWSGMSANEQRAERVDDEQMLLCSTCGDYSALESDGGQVDE
jgi:3'-phosphoadenosine 5'-phosphosulfate sulfotransferase (PAPS reductase)/FAD synthetase